MEKIDEQFVNPLMSRIFNFSSVAIICPDCGSYMIGEDNTIRCVSEGCVSCNVKYELPTIFLNRVNDGT
jgi:predicted RNA-binding Zn-ribbon protein involved in translation (DUF1610 family)